jgi:catechol 2,3-dioxygenase-like lactoylglutathione lyase family enzyme
MRTLDHVGFAVADYKRSKAFYEQALAPLGMTLLMEFSGAAAAFGKAEPGVGAPRLEGC